MHIQRPPKYVREWGEEMHVTETNCYAVDLIEGINDPNIPLNLNGPGDAWAVDADADLAS